MAESALQRRPDELVKSKRAVPALVPFGKSLAPSDRQFHPKLAAEYIRDHGGRTRWIPIGELARTFFLRDSKSNRTRMRQRMHLIWRGLLELGHLLVYDMQRDGVQACKIYDPRSVEERQSLHNRLERMAKQRQLKAEQFQKALSMAECLEAEIAESAAG